MMAGHDHLLVHRVTPDQPLKHGFCAMPHPVGHVFGGIPFFQTEVRTPTRHRDRHLGDLVPSAITQQFQPDLAGLPGLQRIQLCRHFQHPAVLGVEGKGDNLIPRHFHGRRGVVQGRFRQPPLARGEGVELWEALPERLGRVGRQGKRDGEREGPEGDGGGFQGLAAGHACSGIRRVRGFIHGNDCFEGSGQIAMAAPGLFLS